MPSIVAWNNNTADATVTINLKNLPGGAGTLQLYRIDSQNASYVDNAGSENLSVITQWNYAATTNSWTGTIPAQSVVFILATAVAPPPPPPPPVLTSIFLDTFNVDVNTNDLSYENSLRQSGSAAPLDYLENVVNGTVIPGLFQLDAPAAPGALQMEAPNPGPTQYGLSALPNHNFTESTNFTVAFDTTAFSAGAHGGWGGVKILDSTGTPQFVNSGDGFGILWGSTGTGQVYDGTKSITNFSGFPALQAAHVELDVQTSDYSGIEG